MKRRKNKEQLIKELMENIGLTESDVRKEYERYGKNE